MSDGAAAAHQQHRLGARGAGSYGIDATYLIFVPALAITAGILQAAWTRSPWPVVGAAVILLIMTSGLYTSRRGKFTVWSELVDGLRLRGDERVLDLGCGRGAVLMMVARRLTTGRAVGVDLWRSWDQSGNSMEATRRNADADGVSDRIELHTADMSELPLERDSVDLIVSSIAIHNISSSRRYAERLAALRMIDVERRSLGWRMWWGGPWVATELVSATKPLR